jgi:hypothetical protein
VRATAARRRRQPGGTEPLTPKRKWQAITLATLLLVPAYWSILAGIVAAASDAPEPVPEPAASLAFGLALIPFVFIVLAFLSRHPRAPAAVVRAMLLSVAVGVPVSAVAGDAVTGIVAGVGAGGIVALRAEETHSWRSRALAVAFAVLYTFVLVHMASALALLPAPIFPLTAIGIADHLSERRAPGTTLSP